MIFNSRHGWLRFLSSALLSYCRMVWRENMKCICLEYYKLSEMIRNFPSLRDFLRLFIHFSFFFKFSLENSKSLFLCHRIIEFQMFNKNGKQKHILHIYCDAMKANETFYYSNWFNSFHNKMLD